MLILLILFVIVFGITQWYKRYITSDIRVFMKYIANNGSALLGILIITEYILGAIIFIKIILKLMGE